MSFRKRNYNAAESCDSFSMRTAKRVAQVAGAKTSFHLLPVQHASLRALKRNRKSPPEHIKLYERTCIGQKILFAINSIDMCKF